MTWSRWRSTRCWSTAPGSRRSTPSSPGRNPDVMHQPPLDPRTPVIAGVGQASERLGAHDYRQRSPVELAADAAREALADTGADPAAVAAAIDTVARIRPFENSHPRALAPWGRSANYPRPVAGRVGRRPAPAVLEVSRGQPPPPLRHEVPARIAPGRS